MRRLLALPLLLLACPAAADMFQDGSNAAMPGAQVNLGIPVSVTSYGAKCDGVIDDSVAIQAAANNTASYKITFPAAATCVAAGVTFGAQRIVDCHGATIKAPPGSAGKWIFKRTGAINTVENCRFDDTANATMVSTMLTVTAAPGATTLTLASTANLAVGMPVSIALNSGIAWVTRINAIAGSTITTAEGIPASATAVALVDGGDKYTGNDAMIALGGTGMNAPLVLKGTRPAGLGPMTALEIKVPGLYDSVPANPVRFQSNTSRQYTPATANVTWAGAASGAAVKAAYGVLYSENAIQGKVENIRIVAAPVGLHYAGAGAGTTGSDHLSGFISSTNVIVGFFKDKHVHDSFFSNGTIYCGGGAVGVYLNNRDLTLGSGGNNWHSIQALGCGIGFLQQNALNDKQSLLSDMSDYHIIYNGASGIRATSLSVTSGGSANEGFNVGVHVNDSTGVGIDQLSAAKNGTDLNLGDGTSGVYLTQQMGGASGSGHLITGDGASLLSARTYITTQTGATTVGGLGSTIYVGRNGYSATQAGATTRNPEYNPTLSKFQCFSATAPGAGNSYICKLQYELVDTPMQCTIADAATSCIVTSPTFLLGTANLRVNAAIVSSASAPANQFWVSTAGQN